MSSTATHSCSHCAMSTLCLPLGVDRNDISKLENLVDSTKPIRSGNVIFTQGDAFTKIYAVKSGSLKSVHLDENGNEQITAFHLPGELVGLDGIYPEHYTTSTVTLETVVMCEMDYSGLSHLCTEIPSLQKQMFRLLSRDIYQSQNEQSQTVDQTAEQKLANFLHNLSARYQARGFSATQFPMSMPRQDIANYLGMAPETISRLLKRLREKGLVSVEKNIINVARPELLADVALCQGR